MAKRKSNIGKDGLPPKAYKKSSGSIAGNNSERYGSHKRRGTKKSKPQHMTQKSRAVDVRRQRATAAGKRRKSVAANAARNKRKTVKRNPRRRTK